MCLGMNISKQQCSRVTQGHETAQKVHKMSDLDALNQHM